MTRWFGNKHFQHGMAYHKDALLRRDRKHGESPEGLGQDVLHSFQSRLRPFRLPSIVKHAKLKEKEPTAVPQRQLIFNSWMTFAESFWVLHHHTQRRQPCDPRHVAILGSPLVFWGWSCETISKSFRKCWQVTGYRIRNHSHKQDIEDHKTHISNRICYRMCFLTPVWGEGRAHFAWKWLWKTLIGSET